MQMIDVLKRLAELDEKNPNIVKENKIEECEPMGDMQSPKTPATLNITAANGEELGDMLNAIMQLAGVHAVGDEHLGTESPPTVLTTEPGMSRNDQDADSMRTMLDRMNHMSDEAADESMEHDHGIPGVDNVPADPQKQLPFAPNEFSQNTNNGDGKDKHGHPRLTTQPTATYEDLMNEYQNFLKESEITELAKWRDTKYKDKLYTQQPRSSDDDYYGDADYYDPKPDDYPGAKRLHGGGEFDNNDPLDMRHDITRHSDDPEMWGYGTITSKGPRKGLPTKSVVNSLKDKIKKHQGAHPNPTLPENKDAYERDYLSSIAGMDGSDKRDFKRREMEHELGHETNNYSVDINGRTWKVFASKSHAESVAKKIMMRDPSKKVSVHETGAEVSEDMVPTVDQGEYDREGDMVKDNLMTIKREVEELYKILDNNENVPEWVEDKIAQVKGMMTSASEYMQTQHERGEEHDMMEGEGDEAYVACIVQYNRSGQAMVQRTKPISRDRAEEVIRHALSKNTFVHPPFMTIYPASAGKLDGSTIMAQFPDMSKEGMKALAKAGKDGKDLDKVRDKYNKYDEAAYFDPVRGLRDGGTDRLANRQAAASAGELGQDELKKRMQLKANTSLRKTAPSMGKLGSKLPGAANPAYRGPANPYA